MQQLIRLTTRRRIVLTGTPIQVCYYLYFTARLFIVQVVIMAEVGGRITSFVNAFNMYSLHVYIIERSEVSFLMCGTHVIISWNMQLFLLNGCE